MCKVSGSHLNWQQLEHAIKRNFGGFQSGELNPFAVFEDCLRRDHLIVDCEPPPETDLNSEVIYQIMCVTNSISNYFFRNIRSSIQTVQDLD